MKLPYPITMQIPIKANYNPETAYPVYTDEELNVLFYSDDSVLSPGGKLFINGKIVVYIRKDIINGAE